MSLLHDYDAAKRREYYLRTRKLIGRVKRPSLPPNAKHVPVKKLPVKKTHAQRQKELEARVNKLQARLKQLQIVVKAMVEAAQKRSGIAKNTSEKAKASAEKHHSKPSDPTSKYEKKTQKQKNDAAKAQAKYRDKNQVLEEQVTDLTNKIKAIRERIKRLQQTGSVGARNSLHK